MADKRESGRIKDVQLKRVLDDASRKRRQRKVLEALEEDNFQEDPHADLRMSKRAPKFDEEPGPSTAGGAASIIRPKKKKSKGEHYKQRFRKNFAALLDEEQSALREGPGYLSAGVPPSRFPERHFCSVCGFPSNYTCVQCGSRYCSVRCLGTHQDTRCLKWIA